MAITFNSQINSLYTANVATEAAYQAPGTYGITAADVNSAITSVTVTLAGTGFTVLPTVAFAGTGGATATAKAKVVSATVAAAGTGGTPGTQTVTGTTGTGTKFTASVTVSGGGAITAVLSILTGGSYTVIPTAIANEPVIGAGLTGAQLSVALGVESVTVTAGGAYQTAPAVTFGGAGGSGATATAVISAAEEARMLTMIEVIRSYFASCSTSAEAYAMRDIIRLMMGRIPGGNGTAAFNASTLATRIQIAGILRFATQPRVDY